MWIIEALSRDFDVTVYTRGGFDINALNALAGTSLRSTSVRLRQAHIAPHLPLGALKTGAFIRSLSNVGKDYDLRVTLSGVLPWGRPALHFMSSIEWNRHLLARIGAGQVATLRMRLSRWLVAQSSGPALDLSMDCFIANSNWLQRQCAPHCPGPIRVVHPVVPFVPEGVPWKERDDAVLVFGRISPEKRLEYAIRIVERARARGFAGRLLIAGPDGEANYVNRIRKMAARHDWIEMLPSQYGAEKARLLGRVKYGMNACRIEAFGISTGEMAASGIITLVPVCTGQSDIIDDPAQQFSTEEEAVERLIALSRNTALQHRLHMAALSTRDRFTHERFIEAVRDAALYMHGNTSISALKR